MDEMTDSQRYDHFIANYLPDLVNYVVPIFNGNNELGSGVVINDHGRHFVVTAKHCIEHQPRVFRPVARVENRKEVGTRQIAVMRTVLHETLDIGYLQLEESSGSELTPSQLCSDRIVDGMVHVIGYPTALAYIDLPNKNASVSCGSFATTLIEEADEYLKLEYPRFGYRPNEAGQWEPSLFPETPKGFSGGGCFGVAFSTTGLIQTVEYKLLGIQSSWSEDGRWVKVIPIKHFSGLLS
jgi:hypothetical protein